MVVVSVERFHELVEEALLQLPDEFARAMENVAVLVEDRSLDRPLFGLYQGIPLTQRGPVSYAGVLPDRITIYQGTISEYCDDESELVAEVRKTVVHEVGHYFGISDSRLHELGWG